MRETVDGSLLDGYFPSALARVTHIIRAVFRNTLPQRLEIMPVSLSSFSLMSPTSSSSVLAW